VNNKQTKAPIKALKKRKRKTPDNS